MTAADRSAVRVERGEGHPPVVLEVDPDGSTACPTCHERVPLQTALRHAGGRPAPRNVAADERGRRRRGASSSAPAAVVVSVEPDRAVPTPATVDTRAAKAGRLLLEGRVRILRRSGNSLRARVQGDRRLHDCGWRPGAG